MDELRDDSKPREEEKFIYDKELKDGPKRDAQQWVKGGKTG